MREFKYKKIGPLTANELCQIIEMAMGHYFFSRARKAGATRSPAKAKANQKNIVTARKSKSHLVKGGEFAI